MRSLGKAIAAGLLSFGLIAAGLVGTATSPAVAAPDSPALTPPLGWNSWNTFYCDIDEGKIRGAADAMVSSGMKDAGYEYVVVDDCWQAPVRDANGRLQADPQRFPSGMKALGDYIHSKGLKFGIYQAPRTKTCAQFFGGTPGSTGAQGYERVDAQTFASWGVDFLKYDWCSAEGDLQQQIDAFTLMRDELRATGRDIVYSINPNSIRPNRGAEYYWGDIADMWRTTEDITASWRSGCVGDCFMGVTEILDVQAGLTAWNGPGHWNDPDMLEVGKGNILNPTENRAHFGMWALMASPLIAGNDITTMRPDTRDILTNRDLIAVNQDPNGIQASRIRDDGDLEVWRKPLSDGSVAVGLLNRGDDGNNRTISVTAAELGLPPAASYTAKDLYTKAVSNTTSTLTASVPRHGLAVYRVAVGAAENTGFQLQGEQSARCLDTAGGVLNNGVRAVINDCDPARLSQQVADNAQQLIVGGKCLDVNNNGTAAGTTVLFWECNGQVNQKWETRSDGSIRSLSAGKCLDVDRGLTAAGTGLLIWDCNGQVNQKWNRIVESNPALSPKVTTSATGRCVAGKVTQIVRVTSEDTRDLVVSIAGASGTRSVTVPAEASRSVTFSTRQSSVAAGEMTVAAQTTDATFTSTSTVATGALRCGA